MIPAREKVGVDWDTSNWLATENKDFLEYVKQVRQFCQIGDPLVKFWGPR